MENKKIRFPIAIIFLVIELLAYLVYIIYVFKYDTYVTGEQLMSNLFDYSLGCAVALIFVCLLLRKKLDKIFFIGTCTIAIESLIFLIKNFTVANIFSLLLGLLIVFIVGTAILPELSKFKHISEKIYFIPSIFSLLNSIILYIKLYIKNPYIIHPIFSVLIFFCTYLISSLIWPTAIALFLKWCLDPYAKERTTKDPNNVDVNITENFANSRNKSVLDYNESYCELVKHILLSLFTFGIWMLIWIYRTTKALNKAPNCEKYDPTKKLLLCMFVPFYQIYWFYKHGEKIDKLNAATGNKTDNTTMYLLLAIFIPVVACILMQDNINKLCVANACVEHSINSEVSVNVPEKDEKNTVEALKEYKALLDMGVITQEEFDQKKNQLLGL